MKGSTVVITGASRGVGRRLALDFAAAGARVVVNYRGGATAAEEVVAAIRARGGEALAVGADVAEERDVERLRAATEEAFGPAEVLVNNAGINADGPLLEMPVGDWDRVMAVNLRGPFLCIRAFAPAMIERGSGRIINISAYTAIRGRANAANYCAAKAGLNMLTRCAAIELGPAVQVNAIALGFFDSALVRELYSPEQLAAAAATVPARRLGELGEVSRLALFLAGPGAGFMTGQTLALDGGRLLV